MKRYSAKIVVKRTQNSSLLNPKGGKVIHAKSEESAILSADKWMKKVFFKKEGFKYTNIYAVRLKEIK